MRDINHLCLYQWTKGSDTDTEAHVSRHYRAQGFADNAFHFVIRRNGTIETGRSVSDPGCFSPQYDKDGVGVAIIGKERTPEQERAVSILVKQFRGAQVHRLGKV